MLVICDNTPLTVEYRLGMGWNETHTPQNQIGKLTKAPNAIYVTYAMKTQWLFYINSQEHQSDVL